MTTAGRLLVILAISASLDHNSSFGGDEKPSKASESLNAALMPVGGLTYHDDFAGLTLQVPSNAVVMVNSKVQDLAKEGEKLMEERSSRVRAATRKGYRSRTLFRLHLQQTAPGTAALLPGIAAWQEEIKEEDQPVAPELFLMNLRKAMQQGSRISYRQELFSKKTDNLTFTFQIAQIEVKTQGGQVITGVQEQHVVVLGDRAIGFALTYNTASEGEALRDIVWSLELDENDEEMAKPK